MVFKIIIAIHCVAKDFDGLLLMDYVTLIIRDCDQIVFAILISIEDQKFCLFSVDVKRVEFINAL